MIIGTKPSLLVCTLLCMAAACGGASKPAETGGAESNQAESSAAAADSEAAETEAPAEKDDGASAKHDDKTTIPSGLQLLDRRSLSLEFDLNLVKKGEGKGVQSGTWSFSEERTLRVKTAKKDVINELQVVYGKWEAKPLLGLTYEVPTDGKTYLRTSDSSGLKIMRGSDFVNSGEEQRAVKSEYGWVGSRSPLRQALLDAKLEAGASLGSGQELAQQILGEIPGADPSQNELSAVLEKVEGSSRKKATIKVEAKTKITSKKTSFAIELNGTASIDV
ncbi:MAG: hypothetical protein ACM3ZE_29470, partial [Myxococcales bacterium]